MKYTSIIILLFFTLNIANAQNTIIANYNFLHVKDTTQPQNFSSEDMMLIANNTKALYKSFTLDAFLNNQSDLNTNISTKRVFKMPKVTSEQLFSNYNTKEIVTIKPLMEDTFGIKSPLQNINWQLIDSTKQIGNLICKKATGEFKGRKYTCWYSPEIALQGGPWKLHGLPGLIINAHDEKNQVSFTLTSITQTNDKDILLPQHLTYVTETKFAEIRESYKSNMNAMLGSVYPDNNKKLRIQPNATGGKPKKSYNNPLELY